MRWIPSVTVRTLGRSPFPWVRMISGNGKGSEFSTMRQLDRFVDGLPYPDCLPITALRLVLRSLFFRNPFCRHFKHRRRQLAWQEAHEIYFCSVRVPIGFQQPLINVPCRVIATSEFNEFISKILDIKL